MMQQQQLSCKLVVALNNPQQQQQHQVSCKPVELQQLTEQLIPDQQFWRQQLSVQDSHCLQDAVQAKPELLREQVARPCQRDCAAYLQQHHQRQKQDSSSRDLPRCTQLFAQSQDASYDCTTQQQQQQQQQQQPPGQPRVRTQQYEVAQPSSKLSSSTKDQRRQQQARLQKQATPLAGIACWLIWLVVLPSTLQATPAAAALQDVLLPLNPGVYNPSLVVYQGSGWLVARSTQLKWDATGLKWIMNRGYLCQVNVTNWSNTSCYDFDPWRGAYGNQCRWGSAEWKVPWEAWGVDDTKLFHWPGKGLWAITGRRPQQPADSIYCPQPVVWKQWLVQLAREGEPLNPELFDFAPSGPVNVTWGIKPGSGRHLKLFGLFATSSSQEAAAEPVSSSSSIGVDGGGSSSIKALSTSGSSRSDSSSSSSTAARLQGSYRRRRRHRAPWLHTNSSSSSNSSSSDFDQYYRRVDTGVRRRWKVHTRPGYTPPGLQQQQQQAQPPPPHQAGMTTMDKASGSSSEEGLTGRSSSSSSSDAWDALWGKPPIPLAISDAKAVYGKQHSVNEKNWMPFVWRGQLFVTYTLTPKHRVYQVNPDGLAKAKFESDPSAVFAPLGAAEQKLHGGPPLVFVNFTAMKDALTDQAVAAATSSQGPYYLGVAHFWLPVPGSKDGRSYHHYLIKVEAEPPFRVTQLSAELPVRYSAHYKRVAFVSGLDVAMVPQQQQQQLSSIAATSAAAAGRKLKAWLQQQPDSTADDPSAGAAAAAAAAAGGGVYSRSLLAQGMSALQQYSSAATARGASKSYLQEAKHVTTVNNSPGAAVAASSESRSVHGRSLLAQSLSALQQISAAGLPARNAAAVRQPQSGVDGGALVFGQPQRQPGAHNSAMQQLAKAAEKARKEGTYTQAVHGDVTANMLQQQQRQQPLVHKSALQQLAEAAEAAQRAAAAAQGQEPVSSALAKNVTIAEPQAQQQQQPLVHKSALQQLAEAAEAAQRAAAATQRQKPVSSAVARNSTVAEPRPQQQQQQQLAEVAADSKQMATVQRAHTTTNTERATMHNNAADAVHEPQQQQLKMHNTLMQQLAEAAAGAQHAAAAATVSGAAQQTVEHAATGPVQYDQQQHQRLVTLAAAAQKAPLSQAAHASSMAADGISPVLSVAPPAAVSHNRQQRTAPPPATQQQQQKLLPHVLVSYGSGDWESHVTIMTLDDIERLFMAGATALDGSSSSSSSTSDSAGVKRAVHNSAGVDVMGSISKERSVRPADSQAVRSSRTPSDIVALKGTLKASSGGAASGDQGDVDYDSFVADTV